MVSAAKAGLVTVLGWIGKSTHTRNPCPPSGANDAP